MNSIFQMSSLIFLYEWGKFFNIINNIDILINFKGSSFNLYNMDYISNSPFECSKGHLDCVEKFNNLPGNRGIGHILS